MILSGQQPERDNLRTILQAVGRENRAVAQGSQAVDFDWTTPHQFSREELERITALQADLAKKMSSSLTSMVGGSVSLSPQSASEQYADKLGQKGADGYVIALNDDSQKRCGYLTMSLSGAAGWVARLLGRAAAPKNTDRELSQLETVLLLDVVTTMVTAASSVFEQNRIRPLRRIEKAQRGAIQHSGSTVDEFVRLGFVSEQAGGLGFEMYVASAVLSAMTGAGREPARPREQIRKDLLAHLEKINVTGEVIMGSSSVPMGDILSLQPGDVLVIDRKAYEPLEFVMSGRTLLQGYLCSCQGRYALQICPRTKVKGSAT